MLNLVISTGLGLMVNHLNQPVNQYSSHTRDNGGPGKLCDRNDEGENVKAGKFTESNSI